MKRFFLIFIAASFFACEKEAGSANMNSGGTKSDTSNIINQPISGYGPNITDIEGNSYKTVYIGKQLWMAENLKVSKYNDATVIPNVTDETQWSNLTTGAWSIFDNDTLNNVKYGKLYNWYVIIPSTKENKNVCPTGWHVPSIKDWNVLIDYLGGDSVAGGKMKEEGNTNWLYKPNKDASNSSLFTALPGGFRFRSGSYAFNGFNGGWWSSTEYFLNDARVLDLYGDNGKAYINHHNKGDAFSIRCLKD